MRCFCLLSIWSVNMDANKCNQCFYALMDKDLEAPCAGCTGYSNFVKGDMYMTMPRDKPYMGKPLKEAIDDWFTKTNGTTSEDFWTEGKYDVVSRPQHYMLFQDKGIEVRDVLAKLADKIKMSDNRVPLWEIAPLFEADYVQMMQYLMRFMDKNGVEDLKKARWYLDKLIDSYESDV
jgi:hypothetical protein